MRKKLMPLIFSAVLTTSYAQTFYVSPNGTGDCSQANPCDLVTALQNASINGDNDVVYLKEGTYFINNATYAPTGNEWNLTLEGMQNVVIDGANGGRILYIDTTGTDNDDGRTITIKKITFQNGLLEGNNEKGAGVHINTKSANIVIEKCVFKNNTVTGDADAAGLYVFTGTGNIDLVRSVFDNDVSHDFSGGFDLTSSEGVINVSHNIIKNNKGGRGGGGTIGTSKGKIYLVNNIIADNQTQNGATDRGGGILLDIKASDLYVINNTITNNYSSAYGGGIHVQVFDDHGKLVIYNNIIYGNTAEKNGDDIYIETMESNEVRYKPEINIENNDIGMLYVENQEEIEDLGKYRERYNLNEDPLFVNVDEKDYHLSLNSPLIDKGDSSPILPLPTKDIDGDPRLIGNGVDIGADEVVIPQQDNDNTGNDTPPADGDNNNTGNTNTTGNGGGGGGGCSLSATSSPVSALLYLALPFVLLVRRFLRGLGD